LTANTSGAAGSTSPLAGVLDGELRALRDRAGHICDELASLYRRMDDLQQQIEAHQYQQRQERTRP
jgi:hypothetical protein